MKIGYSFWGFLGPGIVDTPDGGRSHRRTLIDAIRSARPGLAGVDGQPEIVFLQPNRDLTEAGLDLRDTYTWNDGFPDLDVLFLEWRWPIPGRNTTACGTGGHTCDMHRQAELLRHYTLTRATPTLLWDKDRQLRADDPLRSHPGVTVCEPALYPSPGARSLLFPVDDSALDGADPFALAALPRTLPLAYVGNQYDRDDAFGELFAPAAAQLEHRVAGKWTRSTAWPHVSFTGRCGFEEVDEIYRSTVATVLLLPDRYARSGQMTQRIFESVLAGCLPLTPTTTAGASVFTATSLHVDDADEVIAAVRHLQRIAGTPEHSDLIADCLRRLDLFRASRQVQAIAEVFGEHTWTPPARRQPR